MRRTVPPLPEALPIRRGIEVALALGLGVVVISGSLTAGMSGHAPTGSTPTGRPLSDPAVFARFDPFFRQGQGPVPLDLTAEGWDVRKIKEDEGCYEVYAVKADGKKVEAYFNPATFELVKEDD